MRKLKVRIEAICDRYNVAPVTPTFMAAGLLIAVATLSGPLAPIVFLLAIGFAVAVWRMFGMSFWG